MSRSVAYLKHLTHYFEQYCYSSGRISRLTVSGESCFEEELLAGACSTSPAHHMSDAIIAEDGYLYVTIGDGAHFSFVDKGINPETGELEFCAINPDEDVGIDPETMGYGSWRSQNDVTLHGKLLRIDPDVILPPDHDVRDLDILSVAGNPLPNIPAVAKGLRMPFRIREQPGTGLIFIGDVGGGVREAIWVYNTTDIQYRNYGWPCKEGGTLNPAFNEYACGETEEAFFAYTHAEVLGESPQTGSSSVSALGFYSGNKFPEEYHGALFFADFARNAVWYVPVDENGELQTRNGKPYIGTFDPYVQFPVDISTAIDGSLLVTGVFSGIYRYSFTQIPAPVAKIVAGPVIDGPAPLTVDFDASDSEGDLESIEWDLNGDGLFDDGVGAVQQMTYQKGVYDVQVRVVDIRGVPSVTEVQIVVGIAIHMFITVPSDEQVLTGWKTGDALNFTGYAIDQDGVSIPTDQISWEIGLQHCIYEPCSEAEFDCKDTKSVLLFVYS